MTTEPNTSLPALVGGIQDHTEAENTTLCQLWLDGINLLARSLDGWDGHPIGGSSSAHAMTSALFHALKTQQAAYVLATGGYYAQALPLVRLCYEDWITCWYLRHWPEEADLLLRSASQSGTVPVPSRKPGGKAGSKEKTLRVQDMLDRIEEKLGAKDPRARAWKDHVNSLAHVGFLSLRSTYSVDDQARTLLAAGPAYSRKEFENCASNFMSDLPLLIEASEMAAAIHEAPVVNRGAWNALNDRITTWQRDLMAERGIPTPGDSDS